MLRHLSTRSTCPPVTQLRGISSSRHKSNDGVSKGGCRDGSEDLDRGEQKVRNVGLELRDDTPNTLRNDGDDEPNNDMNVYQ